MSGRKAQHVRRVTGAAIAAALLLVIGGCMHISETEKDGKKKVDIASPFGSLKVRTEIDAKETGMPLYPGARPRHDSDDKHSSANVDIASSFLGLKVVAASFESDDPPEKVLDFYRDKLKTFGNVLECKGEHGHSHVKPGESKELPCDDRENGGIHINV